MHSAARCISLACAILALAACGATTQQVEKSLDSKLIGTPADAFFARYGGPQSAFPLQGGGQTYRWRGGDAVINVPAQYQTVQPPAAAGAGTERTHTTSTTTQVNPNTTVTETRSSSVSVGVAAAPTQVLVQPARQVQLYCEAQITTDAKGIITQLHLIGDTQGGEMQQSRCAEVFGVRK